MEPQVSNNELLTEMKTINSRLGRLETGQKDTTDRLERLEASTNARFDKLEASQDDLLEATHAGFEHMEDRFQKMGADVETLKSDVGMLKSDMREVKGRLNGVEGEITSLNRRTGRLEGKVNVMVDVLKEKAIITVAEHCQITA